MMDLPPDEGGVVANHYAYRVLEHFDKQVCNELLADARATPSLFGGAFQRTGHLINSLSVLRGFAGEGQMMTPPDRLKDPETRAQFITMILETWRDRGLCWSTRMGDL